MLRNVDSAVPSVLVILLNEVLSLNAQESRNSLTCRSVVALLNEVLSLNAQE